jgi:hypothetical protein
MKIILSGRIDHLNFENEETIHNTQSIHTTIGYSTIAQLLCIIYFLKFVCIIYQLTNKIIIL